VSRKLRITILVVGSLGLLVAAVVTSGYFASQHVPHFYRDALTAKPERQQVASDEMLQNATALASHARHQGRWASVFTAEQINGWLAVDRQKNHPDLLPAEIVDPRVRIAPGLLTIACRYQQEGVSLVVSLNVELYVPEPNVLALRIKNVRAGAIPLPLSQILDGVAKAAEGMNLQLRWAQSKGDPVALVTLPKTIGKGDISYRLETIDLRADAIYLAGNTQKIHSEVPVAVQESPAVASQPASNEKPQR
jgi:uncharacterized protein YpmS